LAQANIVQAQYPDCDHCFFSRIRYKMGTGSWIPEVSCLNLTHFKDLLNKNKPDLQRRSNKNKLDQQRRSETRPYIFEQPHLSVFDQDIKNAKEVDRFRYQYLSKISAAKAWVPQAHDRPSHQTVIIFDWDDTLLYTSYVRHLHLQGRRIPKDVKSYLKRIEETSYQLLETALRLGHTFIITNAIAGWVEESAAHFMPSLIPILQKAQIISARSTQEASCDGDVAQWKMKAFLEMGQEFDTDILTNLVSIGDSDFEMDAANVLGKQFSNIFIKTIKLKERPSPQEHASELGALAPKLQNIIEKACDLRVRVERTS